jgi:dTDP-D-glucose 4,6-dehydratase
MGGWAPEIDLLTGIKKTYAWIFSEAQKHSSVVA